MGTIRAETLLHAPIEECFAASLAVETQVGSMRSTDQVAVAGKTSGVLGLGDTVTWRARHFGFPFRMTTTVAALERPHRFVDEQVRGPFSSFRHEHAFRPLDDGRTMMTDVIEFRAPFGPIGRLLDRCVLCDYVRRLVRIRNLWIALEVEYAEG